MNSTFSFNQWEVVARRSIFFRPTTGSTLIEIKVGPEPWANVAARRRCRQSKTKKRSWKLLVAKRASLRAHIEGSPNFLVRYIITRTTSTTRSQQRAMLKIIQLFCFVVWIASIQGQIPDPGDYVLKYLVLWRFKILLYVIDGDNKSSQIYRTERGCWMTLPQSYEQFTSL